MASGRGSSAREGTAKAVVADHISQAVQSTSNLLLLMQHSSPSQARLAKLPKSLLDKTETIRNTGQVLDRLPLVISSLDAHTENGLHSAPRLKTVIQLLANMESRQLNSLSETQSQSSSKAQEFNSICIDKPGQLDKIRIQCDPHKRLHEVQG